MEETVAQAYSIAKMVILGLVILLQIIAVLVQTRTRPFSPLGLALRSTFAIIAFAVVLVISGVQINWLWAVVAGVAGAALGLAAGRTSKRSLDDQGRRVIKRSPWPALVTAIAYVCAAWAILYATTGVFSVAMLGVLFAAMMVTGAVMSEITNASTSSMVLPTQGAPEA